MRRKLAASVERGDSCVAFYVDDLRVDDIMKIADAGILLPPKVRHCFIPITWFVFLIPICCRLLVFY